MRTNLTVPERFWPKVEKTDGCWLWKAYISTSGYGQFTISRRHYPAHRVSYELLVGRIPEGLEVDHLCRVRHCVNPDHLEPVTRLENIRRGICKRNLTHCLRGHEFTESNTYIQKNGCRRCRTCKKQMQHLYYKYTLKKQSP